MKNAGPTYYFTATNFNFRTSADDIYSFFSQIGNINRLYLFINSRNEFRGLAVIGFDTPAINIPEKSTTVLFEGRRVKISSTKPFDLDACKNLEEEFQDYIDFSHKREFIVDSSLIRDAIIPDPSFLPPKVPVPQNLIEEQIKKQKETKPIIMSIKNDNSTPNTNKTDKNSKTKTKEKEKEKENERESDRKRKKEVDREKERHREKERDHERAHSRSREREKTHDLYLDRDYDRERSRERDRDRDYDRHKRHHYEDNPSISLNDYLSLAARIPQSVVGGVSTGIPGLNGLPVDFLRTIPEMPIIPGGFGTSASTQVIAAAAAAAAAADYLKLHQKDPFKSSSSSSSQSSSSQNLVNSHFVPSHHQHPLPPPPPPLPPQTSQHLMKPPPPPPQIPRATRLVDHDEIFYDRISSNPRNDDMKIIRHQPPPPPPPHPPPPPPPPSLLPHPPIHHQQQRIQVQQPHPSQIPMSRLPPPSLQSSKFSPQPPLPPPPPSSLPPRQVMMQQPRRRDDYRPEQVDPYRLSREKDYYRLSHERERERELMLMRERDRERDFRYDRDRFDDRRYRDFGY